MSKTIAYDGYYIRIAKQETKTGVNFVMEISDAANKRIDTDTTSIFLTYKDDYHAIVSA